MENRVIKIHSAWGTGPERENRVILNTAKPRPPIRSGQLENRTLNLGDVGTGPTMSAFQTANRTARQLALAGDMGGAYGQLAVAESLQAQIPPDSSGQAFGEEDIAYTRQVLAGDTSAANSVRDGNVLLGTGIRMQGTGIDKGKDKGTFTGDVKDSGKGLLGSLMSLSLPIKLGVGVGVALLVRSLLK